MSEIKLFLSWSRNDEELKNSFLKILKPRLEAVQAYKFTWWEDTFILPGEEWQPTIMEMLGKSDYIVQLISYSFVTSEFIWKYEIPGVGEAPLKKTLPVMIEDVSLDGSIELHQIDKRQIYRGISGKSSYISRKSDYSKKKFVEGFREAVVARVENKIGYR